MGISRTKALRRIAGLSVHIGRHLDKMRQSPFSLDYNHWRIEVQVGIRQVEKLAKSVGQQTEREVSSRVTEWKKAIGDRHD
jgi:hypothetical protein